MTQEEFDRETRKLEGLSGAWEVRAGVLPLQPIEEYSRRWVYTCSQRAEDDRHGNEPGYHSTFAKMRAEALDYYLQVSLPHLNNWAELTFIWF